MMNEAYPYNWGNEAVHTRPEAYANYFEQPMNVPMYNMNYAGPVQNGYNYFPNESFYGPAYPYGGGGFQGQGFDYPLQQPEISYHNQFAYGQYNQPFSHPYPKQSAIPRPPTGVKSIMNSFKTQDGTFDVNKMVDTAGQMMNAVTQVSSMVKGLGGMFKV
jgi:hypothetical protein